MSYIAALVPQIVKGYLGGFEVRRLSDSYWGPPGFVVSLAFLNA